MRTIIDLPEEDVKSLDHIVARDDVSRAELVRRAVADYLEKEKDKKNAKLDQYFGIFKDDPDVFDGLDGLSYQEKIRSEWDDRDEILNQREGKYAALNEKGNPTYIYKPSDDKKS